MSFICLLRGHAWGRKERNDSIGPFTIETEPGVAPKRKYSMVRACSRCGKRQIFRDSQWTPKTKQYGGETVEHTPSGWLGLLAPSQKLSHRGQVFGRGDSVASLPFLRRSGAVVYGGEEAES